MDDKTFQLYLFSTPSFNPTYEIKHQIRLTLSKTSLSRDEFVEKMNECAVRCGIHSRFTKPTLDGWCKDSDQGRLPTLTGLVVFCKVAGTVDPVRPLLAPLGCGLLSPEDVGLLKWAQAEMAKRRASKAARIALEAIE